VGVCGAVRGSAGYRGSTELLLVGATDCYTAANRLQTSSTSSSV
jgi:hypothetical protein